MPPPKISRPVIQPIAVPSSGGNASHGTTPTPSTERTGRARQSQFADLPKLGHPASASGPGHARGLSLKRPVKLAFTERLARRDGGSKAETPDTKSQSAGLPEPNPPLSATGPGHAKGVSLKRPVKLAFTERLARRDGGGKAETPDTKSQSAGLPGPNPPLSATGPGHTKGVSLKRPVKLAFTERLAQRDGGGGKGEMSEMKEMMQHQTQMMAMSAQMQNQLNMSQTAAKLSEAGSKAAKELIQ
ncbi:hypothetical protein [Ralstonia solanacearum]|uniref:hypothetical protein n=1 Tax=Ralstonia solanacearum TaxID=305 RepID=UPI0001D96108|nr:hypothetical protein [Ralstonia solanacearum]CBJ35131.1 conserved protein of unknown function [Ralstonia solanacearum PSI07]